MCMPRSGKYVRAPRGGYRPVSCKNNAPQTFFKGDEMEKEVSGEHSMILERRRRLRRKISSKSPLKNPDVVDKDIKELTRLLKIERLKRLIVQKRLETQKL